MKEKKDGTSTKEGEGKEEDEKRRKKKKINPSSSISDTMLRGAAPLTTKSTTQRALEKISSQTKKRRYQSALEHEDSSRQLSPGMDAGCRMPAQR